MSDIHPPARSATRWRLVPTAEYQRMITARSRDEEALADLQARVSALHDKLIAAQIELSRIQMELVRRGR